MLHLILFVVSFLFFIIYLVISSFIYKKKECRKFDIRNTFSYELFLVKTKDEFFANLFLFLSFATVFINFVIYTVNVFNGVNLIICFLVLIAAATFCALSIIPLKKLKEHFTCVILSFIGLAAVGMLLLVNDIRYFKIEYNQLFIISFIADALALIVGGFSLLNPQITNLKLDVDAENNLIRPNFMFLPFSEWMVGITILISQISIVVISMI